jgi:sugar/nucleoside kinase (ribokinase family)
VAEGRPTVVKRRYTDPFQVNKMFEVMWLEDDGTVPDTEETFLCTLEKLAGTCDLVIVADFGHGGMTPTSIEALASSDSFLCVNAQTNSANMGYNLITKYPRADFFCLDEEELRFANHSRHGDLGVLTEAIATHLDAGMGAVTLGTRGSLAWSRSGDPVSTPVLSTDVVDSVGAGDAFLSISSLCAKAGYPPDLLGFLGNCMGGLAVRIVGNREAVEPADLHAFIRHLLASRPRDSGSGT